MCQRKPKILYIIGSHKVMNLWVYLLKALSNIDIWIKANKRQDFGNVIDNRHLLQWLLNIRIWWERESEGRIMSLDAKQMLHHSITLVWIIVDRITAPCSHDRFDIGWGNTLEYFEFASNNLQKKRLVELCNFSKQCEKKYHLHSHFH